MQNTGIAETSSKNQKKDDQRRDDLGFLSIEAKGEELQRATRDFVECRGFIAHRIPAVGGRRYLSAKKGFRKKENLEKRKTFGLQQAGGKAK